MQEIHDLIAVNDEIRDCVDVLKNLTDKRSEIESEIFNKDIRVGDKFLINGNYCELAKRSDNSLYLKYIVVKEI